MHNALHKFLAFGLRVKMGLYGGIGYLSKLPNLHNKSGDSSLCLIYFEQVKSTKIDPW